MLLLPSLLLSFLPLTPVAPIVGDDGPEVGHQAPEPGFRGWIQRGNRKGSTLAALHGEVVVIHTFAWNCASCLRVGLPLAAALEGANADRNLRVLSVTTPAKVDETKRVLKECKLTHAVASENPFTNENPYVDAARNPFTYMFVIGRNGDLAWRGDPSTKMDECLAAIEAALNQSPGYHLERPMHQDLERATHEFLSGAWTKARKLAQVRVNSGRKKRTSGLEQLDADAEYLVARIDELTQALPVRLGKALADKDGLEAWRIHQEIERRLSKSPTGKQAAATWRSALKDPQLKPVLEQAELWLELAMLRPARFPLLADKRSKTYAKSLVKFLKKHPDNPHASIPQNWLQSYNELH